MTVDKSDAVKAGLAKRYPEGRNGQLAGNWQGGIRQSSPGNYVFLHRTIVEQRWPNHPHLAIPGWMHCQEHIIVWEATHNRLVPDGYLVHHIDTVKDHNNADNLELQKKGAHTSHHFALPKVLLARISYLEGLLAANGIPYSPPGEE
jgi:hypothetical protein